MVPELIVCDQMDSGWSGTRRNFQSAAIVPLRGAKNNVQTNTCERSEGRTQSSLYLALTSNVAEPAPNPRQFTTASSSRFERNRCQHCASNAPQTAPTKDLSLTPTRLKVIGQMTGDTRVTGRSAGVRRADRMRFGAPPEPAELQSDPYSKRLNLVGRSIDYGFWRRPTGLEEMVLYDRVRGCGAFTWPGKDAPHFTRLSDVPFVVV